MKAEYYIEFIKYPDYEVVFKFFINTGILKAKMKRLEIQENIVVNHKEKTLTIFLRD
jgi:hypothetical protein